MRVLMLVQSSVERDSRVLRQAATLAEAGHHVHIVGRSVPATFKPGPGVSVESVDKGHGLRPGSRGRGDPPPLILAARSALRWMFLPEHRERTEGQWRAAAADLLRTAGRFDVVHAHDFNTLELAAVLARRWKVPLVYDAHELWFSRRLPGRPTPVKDAVGRRREIRLGRAARVVLTVSEGIAQRLRTSGLSDIRVVHNTFPLAGRPDPQIPEHPSGVVYAGRIGAGRDLETIVAAAPAVSPLRTVLAGPADHAFHLDVTGCEVVPAMPVDEVDRLYRELGIAVVTLTDSCDNHRLALPNKLFHAVRAGVPVVAADLPEMAGMVERYNLGTLYRPGDPASLVGAIRDVVAGYPAYRAGVHAARSTLAWENDAHVLLEVYRQLTGQ